MALKPTESVRHGLFSPIEQEFTPEEFIKDVFNDEFILMVGSEVIMDKRIEPTGDINKYILDTINQIGKTNYIDFNELERKKEDGTDPIRKLLNDQEFDYNLNDISPELRRLLETKLFPVVLTTTFDSYLETLMRNIWGKRLLVANFNDMDSMDKLRHVISSYKVESKYKYNEPTLIYIFGKAVKNELRMYAHTDDDYIRIIDKWMQLKNDDHVNNLIKEKKILALGCKFDDWHFRFFWYSLRKEINRLGAGQVAFMLDCNNPIDKKLDIFLKRKKVYRHDDARVFMSQVAQMMNVATSNNPYMDLILKKRKEGGIFLSYCSEDIVMASKLFFHLDKQGYKVWFDNNNLRGGDNFNKEIQDAIAQAKVFIALLTPTIARNLQSGVYEEKYYVKEWRMACQLKEKIIIPVAVDGYDVKADYHKSIFQKIINDYPSSVDLMKADGFEKLLSSLKKWL